MTKDDIFNELEKRLDLHFPDQPLPNGPFWLQRPYLDDWFDLCMKAYGIVNCDEVGHYRRTIWAIRRQHIPPSNSERQIDELVDAWGHWQFAYRKLVAGE